MAILFAGTSIIDASPDSEGAVTSSSALTSMVSEGVSMGSVETNFSQWDIPAPIAEGWARFYSSGTASSGITRNWFELRGGANEPCVRLQTNGTMQSFNGTDWVTLGDTFSLTLTNATFDVSWALDEISGHVRVYRNKVLVYEFTGNTIFNGVGSIGSLRCGRAGNNARTVASIVIADEDTRPLRYAQATLSAQGFYDEWTGVVGNVSGTGFDDATLVTTDTADNRTTYTKAALNSQFDTGWSVVAAVVGIRASVEAGKAANLRAVARSGTTDGFGASETLATTKGNFCAIIPTDPDASAAWTVATFNSAQFGVQSRAP